MLGDAVMAAIRGVRADPVLAAWFRPDDVGETLALAMDPDVLVDLGSALTGDPPTDSDDPNPDAAAWTVRTIVSLLAIPAGDENAERRLVDRFLVPVVLADASVGVAATGRGGRRGRRSRSG